MIFSMKKIFQPLVPLLAFATTAAFAVETSPSASTPAHEHFDFAQAGRHVTVWLYAPPGLKPQAPIVFVMHGVKRDGETYLRDWIPLAQECRFLLVVPEYSNEGMAPFAVKNLFPE